MNGSASQIAARYRSGKLGHIVIGGTRADSSPKRLSTVSWQLTDDAEEWDSTNADFGGFEGNESSTRKGSGSCVCLWKSTQPAPEVVAGGKYFASFYPHDSTVPPYQGIIKIGPISVEPKLKGELSYTIPWKFDGPYNTPAEPTTIDDYLAKTGIFSPTYTGPTTQPDAALAPPAAGTTGP